MKKPFLLITLVFALTLGSSCTADYKRKAESINQVLQKFNTAYSTEDLQALEAIIDELAIWSIPGLPPVHGKDSILACYEKAFSTGRSCLKIKEGDLQITGNWGILTTTYNRSDTFCCNEVETKVIDISGHNLLVFKKQADKSWKIARDIWNEPATETYCKTYLKTCCKK